MIILMLFILLTLPISITLLWDKKFVLVTFVMSLLFLLLAFNLFNLFNVRRVGVFIIFFTSFIFLHGFLIYKFINNKTKSINFKYFYTKIKSLIPLYLIMGIIVFIRLWYTRFNTDALFYAHLSQLIKQGKVGEIATAYKIPGFYTFAAIFSRSIDGFSIFGDTLVLFMISLAIFKITDERVNNELFYRISIIVASVSVAFSLQYETASLNWVSPSLTLLIIVALWENDFELMIVPIAMTFFSLSSMLVFPIAFTIIVLKKRINLMTMIELFLTTSSICLIFWISYGQTSDNLFISVICLMTMTILIKMFIGFNKEIINPLYRIKIPNLIKTLKNNKKILFTIKAVSSLMLMLGFCIAIIIYEKSQMPIMDLKAYFWNKNLWILPLFIAAVFFIIWKQKGMNEVILIATYFILLFLFKETPKLLNKFPVFVFDRFRRPVNSVLLVIFICFTFEQLSNVKFFKQTQVIKRLSAHTIAIFVSVTGIVSPVVNTIYYSTPSYFSYNPSTNIAENYQWIKNNEWETLERIKTKNIYSDLPVFVMEGKKNVVMDSYNLKHRGFKELFHGDLYTTMQGRTYWLKYNFQDFKDDLIYDDDINPKSKYRWTIEYAIMTNDWREIDKAEIFVFRHKEYAKNISDHYNQPIIMRNRMYIVEK